MIGFGETKSKKGKRKVRGELHSLGLVLVLCALILNGCGSGEEAGQPGAAKNLVGTEWVLTSLGGESLIEGTEINLYFEEAFLGGSMTCNGYGGGPDSGKYIATNEGTLTIPQLAVTVQLCSEPEGIMEQEKAYIEVLHNAATYQVMEDRLEIAGAAGETILVFTRQEEYDSKPSDLLGTAWRLVSAEGRAPVEGSTITLLFHDEHRLSGDAGCREYVAVYEADGDDLDLRYVAMLGSACAEEELREQEGAYSTMLEGVAHYRLGEGQLEILTIRGETLIFEPLPEEARAVLEGPTWSLLAFVDPNPVEEMPAPLPLPVDLLAGTEITLALEDGTARGSAGCNTYQAAYILDGTSIAFEDFAFTEMGCLTPEGVLEQEGRYLDLLRDVTIYHEYGGQLWLETDDGRVLVFSA